MLTPSIPTFVFVFINLLVLFFILKLILFKPVTKFMENRTNSIRQSLDHAQKATNEADALKAQYEDHLRQAGVDASKILSDARERAEREYATTLAAARTDAENMIVKAKEEIERERQQMKRDLKDQVASLALAAASKVLEANLDNESNKLIVEKFINEEGAA